MVEAIWTKKNLKVWIIAELTGRYGERRYAVCKAGADPVRGRFSIRCDEVRAA